MNPENLLYAKSHEWLNVESTGGQKTCVIGISAFAVEALTDLVYLDLPEVGKQFKAGQTFGQVESVKAVSDLYSPVTIEITAVNKELPDDLERLAKDPYNSGWIVKGKVLDESGMKDLMDYKAYQKQCAEEGH